MSVRRATRKVDWYSQVRCPPSPPTPSPSISPSASAPPSPPRLPEQVVAGKRLRSLLRMHGHTIEPLSVGSEGAAVPASASTSSASRQREIIELSDDESVANPTPAVTALLSPEDLHPHPRRRPNNIAATPVAACSRVSAPAIHPAAAPPLAGAGPRLADLKRVVAAWKVRPIRVRLQLQPAARSRSRHTAARRMNAEASARTLRR